VRLVEVRLLEGPNIYRLEPAARIELVAGRPTAWRGSRLPRRADWVALGKRLPLDEVPDEVARVARWVAFLSRRSPGVAVHRSGDPGRWVVTYLWTQAGAAQEIGASAVRFARRGWEPSPRDARAGSWFRRVERAGRADDRAPAWIRDADRSIPIVSVTGTNGKSTTTRLISHIAVTAARRTGSTTSDGVLLDGGLIEPGDWTGPRGAAKILRRDDLDLAVLETARGGILLQGVGYESNEVSVVTNVSPDHLDLQGIHTLPELAEVKAVIARITRPDGWTVLNAEDRLVAGIARRVRAHVCLFSTDAGLRGIRRHLARGGRAEVLEDGWLVEREGEIRLPIIPVADVPITLGGLARHNIANALAAVGAARGLGLDPDVVARGLRDFAPNAEQAPGRLNVYQLGTRTVIVDFAHNEAGIGALLTVAEGLAGRGPKGASATSARPLAVIIGTGGDRPPDALAAIGRIAGTRADRVLIKETLGYLRGSTRQAVLAGLRAGLVQAGRDPAAAPVFDDELSALRSELETGPPDEVIALMCHEQRDEVGAELLRRGGKPTRW
jgi:cyanophycin synthetase